MNANTINIIKIGGKIAENEQQLAAFLKDFNDLKGAKILVHGGGVIASAIGKKLGLQPTMIDGRRVTDKETLEVITMVYAGLINKKIVAGLQALGQNAIGLTGADLNVIRSVKRNPVPIDFGWVGDIEAVDGAWFKLFTEQGVVPVVAPLTHDSHGNLLNTNADSVAAHVASALALKYPVRLTLCFDQSGVLYNGAVVPKLSTTTYTRLKAEKVVTDGMIPKLDLGFLALKQGVKQVRIASFRDIHDDSQGTILIS